jgi:hypothetical protein
MKATIAQILDLQIDIAGIKSGEFKKTGLLNEKINIKVKYWLQKLFKKIQSEVELFNETEKSLFVSLGAVEKEGGLIIEQYLEDGTVNPAIQELNKERANLLAQVVDLGEFEFKIEEFDFETESNYYTFMSVVFDL